MAPETTAPLIEFLVALPVNMGEEGELMDALMDAEGIDMDGIDDIEPEAMAMGIEPDCMGIDMEDMEPEGMAMGMEPDCMGIEDMEAIEPEGMEPEAMEPEGMDMDMDMLLIPIPIPIPPIPMLPSFLASTYETYPVSNHLQTLSRGRKVIGEGREVKLHTSIIAGPATMLSSVA